MSQLQPRLITTSTFTVSGELEIKMNNAQRWGIFFAILVTMIATLWYFLAITAIQDPITGHVKLNGNIFFSGVITIIWVIVFTGIRLELEFP